MQNRLTPAEIDQVQMDLMDDCITDVPMEVVYMRGEEIQNAMREVQITRSVLTKGGHNWYNHPIAEEAYEQLKNVVAPDMQLIHSYRLDTDDPFKGNLIETEHVIQLARRADSTPCHVEMETVEYRKRMFTRFRLYGFSELTLKVIKDLAMPGLTTSGFAPLDGEWFTDDQIDAIEAGEQI